MTFAAPIAAAIALVLAPVASAEVHLFVDDHDIASVRGLTREIGQPVKHPAPIVTGPRDGNFQPYATVIRENGRFRMWFAARHDGESHLGYTESTDGIRFRQADRIAFPLPNQEGVSVTRTPAGYMLGVFSATSAAESLATGGLATAVSPDGLTGWRPLTPAPLFTMNAAGWAGAVGDIVTVTYQHGRYLAFTKMHAVAGDGYPGPKTENQPYVGYRRLVGIASSSDGVTWTQPRRLFMPDRQDPGITEFYGISGIVSRGGLLVGFLRVLRDDIQGGVGHTVLVWSRDGVTWRRDRQPFLDRSSQPGWDHAMAWGAAQVIDGARTLVYYGGYRSGHKASPLTDRSLGVATMPRDRYVARAGSGTLATRPVSTAGLTVNATVRGSLRLRVGRAVCTVRGDGVALRPRCDRPMPKRAPLRFQLRDASVYGFSVAGAAR